MRWLTVGILAIVLVGCGSNKRQPDATDAYVFCKYVVEQQLSAPSTAKFASFPDSTVSQEGQAWHVRGFVDSQNRNGAQVRSDYDCLLAPKGPKDFDVRNVSITPR